MLPVSRGSHGASSSVTCLPACTRSLPASRVCPEPCRDPTPVARPRVKARPTSPLNPAGRPVHAVVREAVRDRILVEPTEGDGAGTSGLLIDSDLTPDDLSETLLPGQDLPLQPLKGRQDGLPTFSTRGLLPGPWERLAREYEVGDVVRGRVYSRVPSKSSRSPEPGPGRVPRSCGPVRAFGTRGGPRGSREGRTVRRAAWIA
jgi:hypothetical protein